MQWLVPKPGDTLRPKVLLRRSIFVSVVILLSMMAIILLRPQDPKPQNQAELHKVFIPILENTVPEPPPMLTETKCAISPKYRISIQQWCILITENAAEFGVDPNLIAAMMLQESGGNSDAYSKSGAVGLMQVMPRDGLAASFNCINGPCFADRPSMSELFNPGFNITYGTRMIAGLIAKHGNERDALLRYGPMNVGYYYADKVLTIRNNHD